MIPRSTVCSGDAVYLSRPSMADGPEFLSAVSKSAALHQSWVEPPGSESTYKSYIDRLSQETHFGFFIRLKTGDDLVGVVNISEVVWGVFRSGYLGYYCFEPFVGRGLMKEGMGCVLKVTFDSLNLHRLEANIQPENTSSIGLIQACGFRHEGFSKNYLHIQGQWRDHERYAMTQEDFQSISAG